MKKTLSTRLLERTDSIEFRKIRQQLNIVAQNNISCDPAKNCYRVISLQDKTRLMLQNEGIEVSQINEFGTDKYLLRW